MLVLPLLLLGMGALLLPFLLGRALLFFLLGVLPKGHPAQLLPEALGLAGLAVTLFLLRSKTGWVFPCAYWGAYEIWLLLTWAASGRGGGTGPRIR